MKSYFLAGSILLASTLAASAIPRDLAPGISASVVHTHSTSDTIVSYDWGAATGLHYMTTTGSFGTGFWRADAAQPTNLYSNDNTFAGASVVAVGNYLYFNDNDFDAQYIRVYGPTTGTPTLAPAVSALNYSFTAYNGGLFVSAGDLSYSNHIYYSALGANGSLSSVPLLDLGETGGGSGPLAFDLQGNLYYAPGYGDFSIYRFAASEVQAALQQNGNPLTITGNKWLDYSTIYEVEGGATSMIVDANGDLLLTLTNQEDPSILARFEVSESGAYASATTALLRADGRLGELRLHEGALHVSIDNAIYAVVPEPGVAGLLGAALALIALRRRRV